MIDHEDDAEIVALLERERVIAIIRHDTASPDRLAQTAAALADNGLHLVEFPLTSPGALEAIRLVSARHPESRIGAGTVMTIDEVDAVADAGGSFIVTPSLNIEVVRHARSRGLATMPGVLSPTEIMAAVEAGATAVKIFPAGPVGPAYIKALLAPFPTLRTIPTGGVELGRVREYLEAGSTAVGLGSDLVGDGSNAEIRTRATKLREQLDQLA